MADEQDDSGARRIIAIFGTSRRRRHWVLAPHTRVVAAFGSVELDLRSAATTGPAAEVQIVAVCGRVTLLVPAGADVELAGFSVAGTSECAVEEAATRPALPPIRASAVTVFGRVRVQSAGAEAPPLPAGGSTSAPPHPDPAAAPPDIDGPSPDHQPGAPTSTAGDGAARSASVASPLPDPSARTPSTAPVEPPRALAVGEVLRRVLPVPVRVRRAPAPFPDGERQPAVVAAYRDPSGRLVGAAVADHGAAASLAAAGSGEPAPPDEGDALPPAAMTAVGEVLREAAALFRAAPDDDAGPLIAEVARPVEGLSDELARVLGAPAARADLVIEVEGQPGGALTFLVAA